MKLAGFLVVFGCFIGQLFALLKPETYVTHKIIKSNQRVEVKSNTKIVLQFNNFFEKKRVKYGFSNRRDIERSKLIDFLEETKSSCEDMERETCFDDNTYYIFQVNDIDGKRIPQLHFFYYFNDDDTGKVITRDVYVNLIEENETLNSLEKLTIKPDVHQSEHMCEVNSPSILNIQYDMDSSIAANGYDWYVDNKSEIKEWIEFLGNEYDDECDTIEVSRTSRQSQNPCHGIATFKFLIKESSNMDLPKIHMELRKVYESGTLYTLDISLKLKKSQSESESECPKNGYPCCTKVNPKVYYTDVDGEWGIEHGEWCFIVKKDPCFSLGYKCCDTKNIVYTDLDGDWGYENGEWCYILL